MDRALFRERLGRVPGGELGVALLLFTTTTYAGYARKEDLIVQVTYGAGSARVRHRLRRAGTIQGLTRR